jgi:hypothetical protein
MLGYDKWAATNNHSSRAEQSTAEEKKAEKETETENNQAHHFSMIGLCKEHQNAMFNAISPTGKQT